MSRHDEEEKRNRSVKLCQLIYERKIDSEIGITIRKLLAAEALVEIDFRDQNRNQKTAIHLAVDKCDVICVKFLLRFKPDLDVIDEDGKTPVELAESNGCQSIVKALRNSKFDVLNETYIEVIEFRAITPQRIEAIKSRPTFKVLKLIDCPTVDDVWRKLSGGYINIFNESSHLFVIAIVTNEMKIKDDPKLMTKVLVLRRPMIVQLTSSNSKNTKIYFKDYEKDFVKISDTPQITQEAFNLAVQSESECNMKLLVAALRSNLFGRFTGNLLDTKLNTNEGRGKAVNQFAKSNALCHRFFKLFDENQPQIHRIVATLSFKGDQSLLSLLDLPFESADEKLKLKEYQQDILSVVDSNGCDLLMMAAKQRNLNAVKLLLRCGCDFNQSDCGDKRASDICWEKNAFDCLAELIEAGSPFPNNFFIDKVDESEAYERINAMIKTTNSFYKNIEDGEYEEVEKFSTSHPNIRHAYDTDNKCALTVALQPIQADSITTIERKVKIYSLLLSKGFKPGADDEYNLTFKNFENKELITKSHQGYFKRAFDDPILKRLVKKSRLSFDSKDRAKCLTTIRNMFRELNKIDEVSPILKICSIANELQIVFDFNCDSVADMDPTQGSTEVGVTLPDSGFVYVGAKNHEKEFCEVIGILIHELTHYAMKLTYENDCRPYVVNDIEDREIFDKIAKETKNICEKNLATDPIVTRAFKYKQERQHQELIVRVPQLLAHYRKNPKALETAEQNTSGLFHFYRDVTLADLKRKNNSRIHKYLIGKINKQSGIAQEIRKMNIQFDKDKVEINLKPSAHIITSNAPKMTLAMLRQFDYDDFHIFVTLEQVAIGNILDKIAKVNAKEISTALIVNCIGMAQKYQDSLRKLMTEIENMKTIALVMTEVESSKVKENFPEVEFKTFDHKWAELTESSKVHLLNQNVIFQGNNMKLNDLVEPSSEAMNFFPLSEIVDCKDFRIGHELHEPSHKFCIHRKFIRKGQANAKSFEELSRDDPEMGAMIISEDAGSSKSVTLFEVAKSLHDAHPGRWVQFVDLKRHIESFKTVEDYEKIESFEDFIVQNIIKNEPNFDRELFKQMFQSGKTFILFDGFDEISPNYKSLLLHVLTMFEPESGNQLYITTRPHLEADLEGVLGKVVFKLEEFSEESKKSFLREYWRSVGLEISDEDSEDISKRLLEQISKTAISNIVGLPLLMRMTAEIFYDPIKAYLLRKVGFSLSIASVFNKFVNKYLDEWADKGNENEILKKDRTKIERRGGALGFHHNIALNYIFNDEFISFDVAESNAEEISRVGLIRFDKTQKTFQLFHETFAEYFVADFIWFHLNKKNQDPTHECRKAIEVLVKVLCDRDDEFIVLNTFLDQTLDEMNFSPSKDFCKSVAKYLNDVLICDRSRFNFLRTNMSASRISLSILLLSIVKHVEKKVLTKMLQPKTQNEFGVLFIAANHGHSIIVSFVCNLIITTDNPKEIFQHAEGYYGNVLLCAARNYHTGVLTTLCTNLDSVLTRDEIKIMFQQSKSGQNLIAGANNDEVFLELISLLPNYLSPDDIKNLLQAVDWHHQNFFHHAVLRGTSESLKLKFEIVKSIFDVKEQKTYFYQPRNMFHLAAVNKSYKTFQTLDEFTRDVLSIDEIKFMLKGKDSEGSNVLHMIAAHGNEVTLNELNLLLRERLSDDEIRSLLCKINVKDQNCFRLAANNAELNFQVFCETIGNLLPIEDRTRLLQESSHKIDIVRVACGNYTNEILPVETIKKLLLGKDGNGQFVVEKVTSYVNEETWNKLISFAQARLSADEMKSFLFCVDNNGLNCLQQAPHNENENMNLIKVICKTIRNIGLIVEDQKKFVRQKDSAGQNLFHRAANIYLFKAINCYSLYNGLSTILSKDEIKEMLKEKDLAGNNILLCATPKYSELSKGEASIDLIIFLKQFLETDEIKDLFFDVVCEKNFFHYTVAFSSKVVIKSVSEFIKAILSGDDQKKFFDMKKSPNVFHLASENLGCLNSGIFSTLHECLKDVLTVNEIKSLLQEKNSENRNVLQRICRVTVCFDNDKRLHDFLKVIKVVLDAEELKTFLKSLDKYDSNCLLLAAQSKDLPFFKELFSFVQSELESDDQLDLISRHDTEGKNIFTCATLNLYKEIYPFVEYLTKEILAENQIEEMMVRHVEIHRKIVQRNHELGKYLKQGLESESESGPKSGSGSGSAILS